ncbi:hypothetical protein FTQ05_23235 [Salmonella enterica]|nr:hypothetical protein [Salmonella enterica]EEM8924343.1 hypothetical protein [Salmonella enterica]
MVDISVRSDFIPARLQGCKAARLQGCKAARLQGQVFKSSNLIYIFSALISEINIAESHSSAFAHYLHSTKYHSLKRGPPE